MQPVVTAAQLAALGAGPGEHAITVTVVDEMGASGSAETTLTIEGPSYSWSGALPPISADGSSVFKAGSTVPVKFRLTGAYAEITNAVAWLHCFAEAGSVPLSAYPFRYDPVERQYVLTWHTKGLPAGGYALRIDPGDGFMRAPIVVTLR